MKMMSGKRISPFIISVFIVVSAEEIFIACCIAGMFRLAPIAVLLTTATITQSALEWNLLETSTGGDWWEKPTTAVEKDTTEWWWPSATSTPWWWQSVVNASTASPTRWWQSTTRPQSSPYPATNNGDQRTSDSWAPMTSPRPATWWPQYSLGDTEMSTTKRTSPTTWRVPTRTTPWFFSTSPPEYESTSHRATTKRPVPTTAPYLLEERQCACDPAKLYLDIVIVVDSSLSMTRAGLMEVAADLATIFQQTNVSSGTYLGQYVRVALVTFSSHAFIHGNLDDYTDYNSFVNGLFRMPYLGGTELNIESALQSASDILRNSRYYARTAILLYTSAYGEGGFRDAKAIANQIKESGTKIITVAFHQQPEGSLVAKLSDLASPGFSFASRQFLITNEILHALCRVNCYCKNNWVQYADDLYTPRLPYGECVRVMDIDASWMTASLACKAMAPNAHLVNEFTRQKNLFVYEYARQVIPRPLKYSIGLRFDPLSGGYAWQTANSTKYPHNSLSHNEWNPGYPNRDEGDCVAEIENKMDYSGGYQNINCIREPMRYICQMPACDTENFCSSPDN